MQNKVAASSQQNVKKAVRAKKVALLAVFIALGVALSIYPGSIPVGPTKVFPFQHMINGILGVILGPWYAAVAALAIGVLRISIGTGTIFALPGGIPGAIVVGILYRYMSKSRWVPLTEPLGTGIGALVSAFIVAPIIHAPPIPAAAWAWLGLTAQWQLFLAAFWASSVPGAILGFIVVLALEKRGLLAKLTF
ncbi:MAG: energy coupling factor transporter S component ThiW [Nitrososphaerales archaeon]